MHQKNLDRKITQNELFMETHVKKKKNLGDEDVWIETCAKATHVRA